MRAAHISDRQRLALAYLWVNVQMTNVGYCWLHHGAGRRRSTWYRV